MPTPSESPAKLLPFSPHTAATGIGAALTANPASAATAVGACFTLNGRAIPKSLAGLQAADARGQWVLLKAITTTTNGCVTYNLWGDYTRYNPRVLIVGVSSDQKAMIGGTSPHYAPGNRADDFNLGTVEVNVAYGNPVAGKTGVDAVAAYSDYLGAGINTSVLCPRQGLSIDCNGNPRSNLR